MWGDIYYKGEQLTSKRIKKLRGHEIVLVPQSVSYLDPLMKVGEQVAGGKNGSVWKKPEGTGPVWP